MEEIEEMWREEFPEDPDGRIEAVLSSVNTEFKSVTLSEALDDRWRTKTGLKNRVERYGEEDIRIPTSTGTYRDYCKKTFIPIGGVVGAKIQKKGYGLVDHYRLTEEGKEFAKPAAQLAIKTANDFGRSLYEILGKTASRGKSRAPYNRARILEELYERENLRRKDLGEVLELAEKNIFPSLETLSGIGFVEFESIFSEERGWAKYEYAEKEGEPETVREYSSLTQRVYKEMKELKVSDYREVAEELNYPYLSHISKVLSGLEEQGFLRREAKFELHEKLSEGNIKSKGEKFVEDFLYPLEEGLESDDMSGVRETVDPLVNSDRWKRYVRKGLELYGKISPRYKSKSKERRREQILSLLEKEGKLRPKEINEKIGVNIANYLGELREEEVVERERDGRAVYYSLTG